MSKRGPNGLFLLVKRSLRPVVWMPMLSLTTLTAILTTLPSTTLAAAGSFTSQQTLRAQTAQRCTVPAIATPDQINPVAANPGITVVTDSPTYYTFRGASQHLETLAHADACARQQPSLGGFHGVTSYTISTAYDTTSYGNDVCRVDNVRVTLHQSILLPSADMSGLPGEVIAAWEKAASRLQAHEYEHVAVNQSYAQSIHDQLVSVSGSCAQVATTASSIVETGKARMRAANRVLDSQTNHGVR